jgi:hypothetical protein
MKYLVMIKHSVAGRPNLRKSLNTEGTEDTERRRLPYAARLQSVRPF